MKLLVLEGLDGAGKSTQLNLVQDFFNKKNIKFKYLHYPRTDTIIWGELISMFLRGEFGKIEDVDPYLVALIYAGDRNEARPLIDSWLNEGHIVILDRYVYSNIAYQCAKVEDVEKKSRLKNWIKKLEFEYNSLHSPCVSLFLDVPFEFTVKKLNERVQENNRNYLKGSNDIHEQNLDFQNKVRLEYLSLIEEEKNFKLIKCSEDDKNILPVSDIFEKIKSVLLEYNFA
jgi:dTMP kinase